MLEMTVDDMPPAIVSVVSTDVGKRVTVRLSADQVQALAAGAHVYLDDVDDPISGPNGLPLDVVSIHLAVDQPPTEADGPLT